MQNLSPAQPQIARSDPPKRIEYNSRLESSLNRSHYLRMIISVLRCVRLGAIICLAVAGSALHGAEVVELVVDAHELPRKLLHSKMTFPVSAGQTSFWYPKWIPGIHAPRGPVENIAGLRFESPDGDTIKWKRDQIELYQFHVELPAGARELVAKLDYIANQPNSNSGGIDSYGNAFIGSINLNTCILYPDGVDQDNIEYRLKLRLPKGWKQASALDVVSTENGWIVFKPVTLEVLVDSPIICGEFLRTVAFTPESFPTINYHLNSESAAALQLDDKKLKQFESMATQAARLFKTAPFKEYHFLVTASDDLPGMGLEHTASSLNGVPEQTFKDDKKWQTYIDVLPHEIAHAWCGKWRRPIGMVTGNFHAPNKTGGLWVYEGLTQYLGHLMFVRSGFITPEQNTEVLARTISRLQSQKGRQWRPLKDTAVDSWQLRGRSQSWGNLRRNQDYYSEGMLIWMEVDAIIRRSTDGRKSLDNFVQTFFKHNEGDGLVKSFDRPEIISQLNELVEFDWTAFFDERVSNTQEEFPLTSVERLGYRLEYAAEPGDWVKMMETQFKYTDTENSIGIGVREAGNITGIVPGSPADKAGLAPGQQIVGVNGRKFSTERFKEGIADTTTKRRLELLTLNGDLYETVTIDYAAGARHLKLVRNTAEPDILSEIFKAK